MLNFIQPKTVKVYSNKPSIEEQIPVIQNAVSCATPLNSNYVIHKVSPNETLDRICLIYNCPKDAIRKANGFSGDEIYMKKELIIPSSSKLIYIQIIQMGLFLVLILTSRSMKISAGKT